MYSLKTYLFGGVFVILALSIGVNLFTFQLLSKKNLLIAERDSIISVQNAAIDKQQQNISIHQQSSEEINAQRQKNFDYMRGYNEAVSKINSDILEIELPDYLASLLP